ncbi:GNAT family N-acetyltransferase [Cytobacillus firmus]|uniref:GNAT family N-acetyltransferase n=1 Tax=Cytobacillus firmus TaxID=1399 RepID=UPI0015806E46|nr:GNAT family N-acetyltransferase [Cytobacillus firmus]MBG9550417.1 GCN5 family acetyltransferase [Cytobacillus firmus]MBG9604125.1 GCN5 family acetyltransferase [Cytobacillus firmus]MBG9657180.1 GCN5 family acetyltransferase [Cytobacillus firmus]MDD9311654.1 GNAT family N-acetyltransferase [Cytobacillus firmus]MED1909015.1 GNAT family N-acetyltransferase [Cytobacillus firmus]
MIKEINIKDRKAAEQVLSVQLPAYKIEAEIIGYPDLPPLKDSADSLRTTGETFFGYFTGEKLCGAISFKEKNDVLDIHRLIVHPEHFRKGIAQKLLNYIGRRPIIKKMIVTTGSKNTPAVAFYLKNGFKEVEMIKINDLLTITAFEKLL